jgi:hypothetical protein
LDFLWQNAIWVIIGLVLSKLWRLGGTRVRRRRLRQFFGTDALNDPGILVTVPVLRPLSKDNFDPSAKATVALKSDDSGKDVRRPIYGEVLHLDDYESAEEIFRLLRGLGAKRTSLIPDSQALGNWDRYRCLVCLGSPFVNASLGELLRAAATEGQAPITGSRESDTLDSYRVVLSQPETLTLGVDEDHAMGVIARLAHPLMTDNWVIGVWGCRAESTRATARYLHREFKKISQLAEAHKRLIILLAVQGRQHDIVSVMYAASDRQLSRNDELLRVYDRAMAVHVADDAIRPGA